ncbi:MAG TPA: hypothetical protein ENI06_06770 [Spirochaetales bacterium]|nr:hypothetical protein [Spirochaetales bacterium]
MAIISIEDLLNRAREFEERLEKYYASIRDESQDNGVRLLTYYLSRHRRHLEEALSDYSPEELSRIGRVKLKYDIEFYPEKVFHLMKTPPQEVKGRELLEAAVGYDTELVDLYKKILQQPLSTEAAVLIESLIRLEERDIIMLKKMIAMNYF